MKIKSHAPRLATAVAILSAFAGSAIAKLKPAPQILLEMRAITAPIGAERFFREGKRDGSPSILDAEEFQAGLQKLAGMDGVDTVSTPKVITRSGQRATIEIGAKLAGEQDIGMKFDVLPKEGSDGHIHLDLSYTNTFFTDGKIRSRALKTNATIEPGCTLIVSSKGEETGRLTLIAVTPSTVAAPAPGVMAEPGKDAAVETPLEKAKAIVIPQLTLKAATVTEAVDLLRAKARELDPEKKGVNFVLAATTETVPTKITVSLKNIPLSEAIKYVTALANMRFREEKDEIIIIPVGVD